MRCVTLAPSVFRIPISFVRRSARERGQAEQAEARDEDGEAGEYPDRPCHAPLVLVEAAEVLAQKLVAEVRVREDAREGHLGLGHPAGYAVRVERDARIAGPPRPVEHQHRLDLGTQRAVVEVLRHPDDLDLEIVVVGQHGAEDVRGLLEAQSLRHRAVDERDAPGRSLLVLFRQAPTGEESEAIDAEVARVERDEADGAERVAGSRRGREIFLQETAPRRAAHRVGDAADGGLCAERLAEAHAGRRVARYGYRQARVTLEPEVLRLHVVQLPPGHECPDEEDLSGGELEERQPAPQPRAARSTRPPADAPLSTSAGRVPESTRAG